MSEERDACPDCGSKDGELHRDNCDVERCPDCGGQYFSCDCEGTIFTRIPWNRQWPGIKECMEFGWYARMVKGMGWVSCDKGEDGATEDLNRLIEECVWSQKLGRFIKDES